MTRERTPNVNFGKSQKRSELVGKEDKNKLGPGAYDADKKKNTVSFTMGKK